MNPPTIFAEFVDARCALFCGRKMQMSKFCYRMAERIVDLSERAIAAMNVRDDAPAHMSCRRGGEGFDAIADEQDNVCFQSLQGLANASDRKSCATRQVVV